MPSPGVSISLLTFLSRKIFDILAYVLGSSHMHSEIRKSWRGPAAQDLSEISRISVKSMSW